MYVHFAHWKSTQATYNVLMIPTLNYIYVRNIIYYTHINIMLNMIDHYNQFTYI